MSRAIPLSNGDETLVDDEDYYDLAHQSWSVNNFGQVVYWTKDGGKVTARTMSRLIMNAPKGLYVTHLNGDLTDNRRANLRLITHSELMHRRRSFSMPGTSRCSQFKGVYWDAKKQNWRARLKLEGKFRQVGYFPTEEEAARAYDKAALEFYGELAHLNFPAKEQS